jgi:hypothetical protein
MSRDTSPLSIENVRPWVTLYDHGKITYTERHHRDWMYRVAELGCDHPAIEANGSIALVTCSRCRDEAEKLTQEHAVQAHLVQAH